MAHHDLIIHPLVLRCVHVIGVVDITPRMRRVTLSGDQLAEFPQDGAVYPAFAAPGFDDHVKLIFASDGDIASVLPVQLPHGIEWGPAETRQGRDYTPRRFDPVTRELDLDFVLHGDGPAASWAQHAQVGDELWFAGPKSSTVIPNNVDWVLLAGDETALPAIARYLDERPVAAPVRVVITIADELARQDLQLREGDSIEWVLAPATDEQALATAVTQISPPDGVPYVWAAAESRALLPVRRFARALGAPKTHINITGYWNQREQAESATARPAAAPVLPEAPVMWFALRAALTLGLLEALADAPLTNAALATQLRTSESRLSPLLTLLTRGGILVHGRDDRYALDRLGEELSEDEHARERFTGFDADQVLSLAALPAALRGGESAWQLAHGSSLRESVESQPEYYAELIEQASGLPHVLSGLAQHTVWNEVHRLVVTGPGAVEVGALLSESAQPQSITIHESAGPLELLRAESDQRAWEFAPALPPGQDLAVTALAFSHRTDREVVELLRTLATAAPRALLIERLSPDGLSPAAGASQGLVDYAVLGTPARTPESTLQLIADSGWAVVGRQKLGWGIECVELAVAAPRS